MAFIPKSTLRRLQKLQPATGPWECDRTPLPETLANQVQSGEAHGMDWIFCVDDQAMVRAIELIPRSTGPEALMRALIQAMERPKGPMTPARPSRILVCDREVQFFLRGALHDLNIGVDYVPTLPFIEAVRSELMASLAPEHPTLPEGYESKLLELAQHFLALAPWEYLEDHEIIEVNLKFPEPQTLYVCLLGFLGVEYGVLLYRSLDSLRQFRTQVLDTDPDNPAPGQMEAAFLSQDCLFLNFEDTDAPEASSSPLTAKNSASAAEQLRPAFGSIHPLEGVRPFVDEDEAQTLMLALEALSRFFRRYGRRILDSEALPEISNRFRINFPELELNNVSVQVRTRPDISATLFDQAEEAEYPGTVAHEVPTLKPLVLQDQLVPEGAIVSLGMVPWSIIPMMRSGAPHFQAGKPKEVGDGCPALIIQTSQPKAKKILQLIQGSGGVKAMGFATGLDPKRVLKFDLGVVQLENGQFHLFGEYDPDDPIHARARQKWDQRIKNTKGWCALLIARGVSGMNRGNPQIKDVVALCETRACTGTEMGFQQLISIPKV